MYFLASKVRKIWEDHKKKSDMVRVLKKKLKNRISVNTLKEYLAWEKKYEVDTRAFQGWTEFDDVGYERALATKQARIDLLEELIRIKERD